MLATLLHLVPAAFLSLLVAALIYVSVYGQAAERACIIAATIASIATALAANSEATWYRPEIGIFLVDLLTLAAFIAVMAKSRKFWPLWITALQIVAVMTHVARYLKPLTAPLAYAVAEQLWAYIVILILIMSVWMKRSALASTS